MADARWALLDSGKLSEEEKVKEKSGWTSEEEELEEEYRRLLACQGQDPWGFDIDDHVRNPKCAISTPCNITLYGRLGVHCFNFEKGRKLQFMGILEHKIQVSIWSTYLITAEVKDLVDDAVHFLQSSVTIPYTRNGEQLRVFNEICILKPEKPGEGGEMVQLNEDAVDELYKVRMPNFLSEAKPDDDDRLRFYEVQEQDICENDWLRLYTDFALYCYWQWQYNENAFTSCLPAEINKILVETLETHTDPSLKLKSSNAIFHISFTANSCDYISVVRRTTDGKTGHIILEISTWTNPPSSPCTPTPAKIEFSLAFTYS